MSVELSEAEEQTGQVGWSGRGCQGRSLLCDPAESFSSILWEFTVGGFWRGRR